jgi:hypothetical protein
MRCNVRLRSVCHGECFYAGICCISVTGLSYPASVVSRQLAQERDVVKSLDRDAKGLWLPGRSGNYSGRTHALREVARLARTHTEAAISTLAEILNDKEQPSACRIVAANSLLDRGYGKPSPDSQFDDDTERTRLAEAMQSVLRSGVVTRVSRALSYGGADDE